MTGGAGRSRGSSNEEGRCPRLGASLWNGATRPVSRALPVAISLAVLVGACCPRHGLGAAASSPVDGFVVGKPWLVVEPDGGGVAREVLSGVRSHYERIDTYRDEGIVITTEWGATRSWTTAWFDTLYVKGVGLRFRFYDEHHRLVLAVALRRGTTLAWRAGSVREAASPSSALVAYRGVTSYASQLVPQFLLGPESSWPVLLDAPPSMGPEPPISCGRCQTLLFGGEHLGEQRSVIVDENLEILAFEALTARRRSDAGSVSMAHVQIAYLRRSPQTSREEATRELDAAGW